MLIKSNTDYTTLVDGLLDEFKAHLRINYTTEDDSIKVFLAGSIDAISTYGDNDIFLSEYNYEYIEGEVLDTEPNSAYMYIGKNNISNVVIKDGDDTDVTANFTIDNHLGYIYPAPSTSNTIAFSGGYATEADIQPNLKMIIFRYGAFLFEMREAIQIGEPKNLPDWVNYALASIWKSRV